MAKHGFNPLIEAVTPEIESSHELPRMMRFKLHETGPVVPGQRIAFSGTGMVKMTNDENDVFVQIESVQGKGEGTHEKREIIPTP